MKYCHSSRAERKERKKELNSFSIQLRINSPPPHFFLCGVFLSFDKSPPCAPRHKFEACVIPNLISLLRHTCVSPIGGKVALYGCAFISITRISGGEPNERNKRNKSIAINALFFFKIPFSDFFLEILLFICLLLFCLFFFYLQESCWTEPVIGLFRLVASFQ